MTSFKQVWWVMAKERGRQLTQLLGIDLAVVVVLIVMRLIGRLSAIDLVGFTTLMALITAVAGFVAMAQSQEQVWVTNRWRLIPVANWRLYLASTLANTLAIVLLWVVLGVLEIGIATLEGFGVDGSVWRDLANGTLPFLAIVLAFTLLLWSLISLAHMLSLVITDFLPGTQGKWLRRGLTFIIVLVALKLVDWLFTGMAWLIEKLGISPAAFTYFGGSVMAFQGSVVADMWLAVGMVSLGAVVLSVINCYLLAHWVETKQLQQMA
ncbi:hypothetical protein ACFQ5J_07985 [Lacticaseibacillus baoqingensis]|uniref:ABC transporter permease n=1 Tax=Lacticaseibacillus baoqingensis TaxID=2486013 RepID=A0ABW4E5K3_9LACO|nr:hypothetical protein [Lacticaseibacillus baoqingensis]